MEECEGTELILFGHVDFYPGDKIFKRFVED